MSVVDLSELNKNILNDVLCQIKSVLDAESASLFLFDQEREELVLNSIFNEHKVHFKGIRQRIGQGIAGSVANECKAVLVKDIKTDPRFQKEHFRHYLTDSFICVPIKTRYGLIGVINISDKTNGDVFTEEDFGLSCLMAHLASLIVENQITIAKLKEENETLKREKDEHDQEKLFLEKFVSIGRLAGGIVHEINNPLDAVMRYTNLLLERDVEGALAREYLNEIKVGLVRIMKITRSLLEFSQQLKDSEYYECVDVHDVLDEALSLFRHTIFLGQIKIEKEYNAMLPKVVDKGLCRIFSNIIKNAFDAMPSGGTLEIRTSRDADSLLISFKDTGTGISDEIKNKIFTPFFTTKPIGQGIGLGLPICFEVVQRYEGKIDVESKTGVGTEFRIRLSLKNLIPS